MLQAFNHFIKYDSFTRTPRHSSINVLYSERLKVVSVLWQLFDMWNKECRFHAKDVSQRFSCLCPVIVPATPCDQTSYSLLCCVKTPPFIIFFPICEYRNLSVNLPHHTYSEIPFNITDLVRQYSRIKNKNYSNE